MAIETFPLEDDPLWYKDAIVYELPVKSFYDSNADGIGDFPGLREKLDYLKDLGATAIWLLPFYSSPLRDDGYDISDYFDVHPDYGTLKDFRDFLREAHRRGIRVITELVINHTSDQHPWFRRSRQARPGSVWRNLYVWSDTPEKYKEARIIFQDFETSNWAWDPVAGAYYWHRFYAHQPDLNFDSPEVRKLVFRAIDFWLGMGVDGLRLDAVPYLFEREGTSCENLPETYAFLQELRSHVDANFKNRMLLAEANQWPEDAAAYFGQGDICHMAFHFPLMPRMFLGLQTEDRFPIIDILNQTPAIPESCQWALFLRNHDELTLEMVTDEERDYMYRVYARDPHARINLGIRRRLAPLMENNLRRMELIKILLFFLPGTPVLYYGDEIGMGDDYYLGDRNGVRTPMQWSPDRNAGFSRANPQRLYMPVIIDPEYHYISVNVENQQRNPSSFLWWMKRVVAMRKRFKASGRGALEFLFPENPQILAFLRSYQEERLLIVANLSRYAQVASLDLAPYSGFVPEEVMGLKPFPIIRESPYSIILGPYGYLLLSLQKPEEAVTLRAGEEPPFPELHVPGKWQNVWTGEARENLERRVLPGFLKRSPWFLGKKKVIREVQIVEAIPVAKEGGVSYLLLLDVRYGEGGPETYLLPVSFAPQRRPEGRVVSPEQEGTGEVRSLLEEACESILARLFVQGGEGLLYDAVCDARFREALLAGIARRRKIRGVNGEVVCRPGSEFRRRLGEKGLHLISERMKAEQRNTSLHYEDRFYFKLYRRLEEGMHPELEITRFLVEQARWAAVPPYAGSIVYQTAGSASMALGLLQGYVTNQGDGWTYTRDELGRYAERVLSRDPATEMPKGPASLLDTDPAQVPPLMTELIEGSFLEMMALLGRRTGEMHNALSSRPQEREFAPEPFSRLYQRSVFQSMRFLLSRTLRELKGGLAALSEAARHEAAWVLQSESKILEVFQKITAHKILAVRIRIHGDYHLAQVLYTGKDFVVIDFEGEAARSVTERRLKQPAFRDVAGMIRSFHYAAAAALLTRASVRPEDENRLEPWMKLWYRWVAGIFLHSYLAVVGAAPFLPGSREEREILLRVTLLEKAIYQLGYELRDRPPWVLAPLRGIRELVEGEL